MCVFGVMMRRKKVYKQFGAECCMLERLISGAKKSSVFACSLEPFFVCFMNCICRAAWVVPKFSQCLLQRHASFHFFDLFKNKTQKDAEGTK